MDKFILPTKPIKNEDGTYTLAFPDIVLEDERTADILQMTVTEFILRLLYEETTKFEEIRHHPRKNEEDK